MSDYYELAERMEKGEIKKYADKNYYVFDRKWLLENLELEFDLLKATRQFNADYNKQRADFLDEIKRFVRREDNERFRRDKEKPEV